ncbi:putative amidohydrolase [Leucobacter luti]|uniref:nitrilase-related carbon-nitrogen hydrolase n=1 Tax=Leucobacter luti TaxID=340320 RepID=UPI0010498AB5|nr:nitrilase-related carbon-nitrogen hydrolase [Leucobacter luti]MCW2289137.1 putative amidohydrolase [Leucobacter luti]TCK35466.1 putative amidohydrolase [Leucobacter luti]
MRTTVAIAQITPPVLDTHTGVRAAADAVAEAARAGARVVAFAETWLGGYPAWAFGHAGWSDPIGRKLYGDLLRESVVLRAGADGHSVNDDLSPLRTAARAHDVVVVIGANERPSPQSGTVFNSLITIGTDGRTVNVHRKTTPTLTEKLVHAPGDAAGLGAVDTPHGRLGGLICWEHWNPLARAAAHATEEQIHVAAWPDFPEAHLLASRSYAYEGRTFVLAAAQYLPREAVPAALQEAFQLGAGAGETGPFFDGGSCIIAPDGSWILEPQYGSEGIFVRELDLAVIPDEHYALDVNGHYGRPDIFDLRVRVERRSPVTRIPRELVTAPSVERGDDRGE